MLPLLRESSDARIVNVSSAVGSLTANADPASPYHQRFGPVYSASKAALNAPCHIVCGALDLLVIENLTYAQRLVSQGVPTEVHIYPGALHGFMNATETDLSKNYFEERKHVFQRAFATARS